MIEKITNQTRELINLEGCHVVSPKAYKRIVFERQMMAGCLLCCALAVLLFIVSVATINWATVAISQPNNSSFILHLGVWGEFRTDYDADKNEKERTWIPHFPKSPKDRPRLRDQDLPHYHRAQAVFSVIALAVMICSICVGVCSLKHHRYMYKRLTAGIMFIAAMCILVTTQVLVHSIEEWSAYTEDASKSVDYVEKMSYGFSTILAWLSIIIFCASALIFLFGGRKHKGLEAATQEFEVEDRPMNLG